MADQTQVNGAQSDPTTMGQVTDHVSSLAYDLITLAELQTKLFYVDLRSAGARSARSGVSLAAMIALTLGCVPVLLLGGAELLIEGLDWSRGFSYLLVAGAAGIFGVVMALICIRQLRKVIAVFARSHQELQANLEFVKSLVQTPPDPSPRPHRSRF